MFPFASNTIPLMIIAMIIESLAAVKNTCTPLDTFTLKQLIAVIKTRKINKNKISLNLNILVID